MSNQIAVIRRNDDEIILAAEDVQTLTFKRNPALIGSAIRIYDAQKRYDILYQTLAKWTERGLIRVLKRAPGLLELDEADVALAARIYHTVRQHTTPQHAGRILNRVLS